MVRIISALILGFSSAWVAAQPTQPLQLASNAPDRHIVQRGDTLWGIAGRFLKEPWRWPEIWRMNRDQINNPHRIYPGQVVILDTSGATPRLVLGQPVAPREDKLSPKVYAEPAAEAIPAIPHQVIEPFLSEPLIVEENGLASAPKIVATQESRVNVGAGNVAYVSGLNASAKLWEVYRPVRPILDPATAQPLAYEAQHLGSARVLREGEPATLEIVSAKQEIGVGDRLVPLVKSDLVTYAPHAPDMEIEGRIVGIYAGVNVGETGQNYVVTLNLGRQDGLEIGHVLAIYRNISETYTDERGRRQSLNLPPERYGLLFVFRTFDRVAYALVMNSSRPVLPNDLVRKP